MITYKDFEIVQVGKQLTCTEKILINKYDNQTIRFHFTYDGTLDGNFYIALKNPTLNKYFIEPIVDDYYEITSSLTVYPGRWTMILIVTDLAYEITEDTFDQSQAIYVSDEFSKIIIKDNFLNQEDQDAISPVQSAAINALLNRVESTRQNFVTLATNAAEAAETASLSETNCRNYNTNISLMYDQIVRMYNELKG